MAVPVSYETGSPLAFFNVGYFVRPFLPEEAKPTVRLSVDVAIVNCESLRNRGLQLRHSSCCLRIDVGTGTKATMPAHGNSC